MVGSRLDRTASAKGRSVDADLTILPPSLDVCTNPTTTGSGEPKSWTHRARSRCLNITSYIRLHREVAPQVRVRGMLADPSSCLRSHSSSDLRHIGHETQRSQIDRIDLPLGTTHAQLATNACANDDRRSDDQVRRAAITEQKTALFDPTRTLPAVFI